MKLSHLFIVGVMLVIVYVWHDAIRDWFTELPFYPFKKSSNTVSAAPEPSNPDSNTSSNSAAVLLPGEVTTQRPISIRLSYGEVKIPSGTRLAVLRDEGQGVLVQFNKENFIVPKSTLLPPAPTMFGSNTALSTTQSVPTGSPVSSNSTAPPSSFSVYKPFLLIVKGNEGAGSASIVNIRGTPTVVTNIHVISANSGMTFRGLDATPLRLGALAVSSQSDLAIAAQQNVQGGIPMMENVEQNVQIGDAVTVLGNSLGSSVITEIKGKVTGIGPDLIETDAKFVEGNSGSPIIHTKTGKVIAIATFAIVHRATSLSRDSQFTHVRRFGYRLDTARFTEYPTWDEVSREGKQLETISKGSEYLISLYREVGGSRPKLTAHQGDDDPLRVPILDYLEHVNSPAAHAGDIIEAKERLLRAMIFLCRKDSDENLYGGYITFHRKRIHEEVEFRKLVQNAFAEMLNTEEARKRTFGR
jgi:hypothetical protein